MRVSILGGGGFLGQKLAAALAAKKELRGAEISALTLADLAPPPIPEAVAEAGLATRSVKADVSDAMSLEHAIPKGTDVVFNLAAVVSAQAEADFDLGLRVNLNGAWNVLERCRGLGSTPVLVFASSVAAFGGEPPEPIGDFTILNPQNSYGTQKAIGELLLNDYSRRGLVDGRGLRLPTVTIRPGKPNAAASSFVSSIFREPLQGETAVCPVTGDCAVWWTAPRTAVANLIKGADIDGAAFGSDRCISLPGATATVDEMVAAMRAVSGDAPVDRIQWVRDANIERIVGGWKARFAPEKALRLGFAADASFEDAIRWFLEDDVA